MFSARRLVGCSCLDNISYQKPASPPSPFAVRMLTRLRRPPPDPVLALANANLERRLGSRRGSARRLPLKPSLDSGLLGVLRHPRLRGLWRSYLVKAAKVATGRDAGSLVPDWSFPKHTRAYAV